MNTVTLAVVGAVLAELILGRKLGSKAIVLGLIIMVLPDVDLLVTSFMEDWSKLDLVKRVSHSLAFSLLASSILGWIFAQLYTRSGVSQAKFTIFSLTLFWVHIGLDVFTIEGAALLYPIRDQRFSLSILSPQDPGLVLAPLLGLVLVFFIVKKPSWKRFVLTFSLVLSAFYVVLALTNKAVVDAIFANALHLQGRSAMDTESYPTSWNNLYWYVIAKEPSGFHLGYYSLLEEGQEVTFMYIPSNQRLLPDTLKQDFRILELASMTQGFYSLRSSDSTEFVYWDLRYGLENGLTDTLQHIQPYRSYKFHRQEADDWKFSLLRVQPMYPWDELKMIWGKLSVAAIKKAAS